MGRLDLPDVYRDEDDFYGSPVDSPPNGAEGQGTRSSLRATEEPPCECHGEPMYWQPHPRMRTGGRWTCRVKQREYMRQWRIDNRERAAKNRRRQRLKSEFGITPEDYDAMLAEQHGVCALCKSECITGMRLAVDHDHKTGVVRGLLCGSCNRGIGHFDDDPEFLRAAASYLEARNV